MELLYRGFDGLDVSFRAQIPTRFSNALEEAKQSAQRFRSNTFIEWNGVGLEVYESGARGGYAFKASTGAFGATWFFKKNNAADPWGVRVSCNSFFLATNGLGETRAQIYRVLETFGVSLAQECESIGRVDYALDFLLPGFQLVPENFVMHSNARRVDHVEHPEITINGRSGRVTSVTVGRMPGRQVIVYDKRTEVISKRKFGWWEIWDATRLQNGLPVLQRDAPSECAVWRVEIRAGKRHLKDRWAISTWADLHNRFGDLVGATLDAIRYAVPTLDSNRSRWPESDLWGTCRCSLHDDLFEMASYADPDLVKRVEADAHSELLFRQMVGLLTTRAAICGVTSDDLAQFAVATGNEMAAMIGHSPSTFALKWERSARRYDLG